MKKNRDNLGHFVKGHRAYNKGRKMGVYKTCLQCRLKFYVFQCEKNKKYCSHKCYSKFSKGKRISPATEFRKGQHPSPKTEFKKGIIPWNKGTKGIMKSWNKGKSMPQYQGEKHWNWQGGITSLAMKIRNCLEMKLWKTQIFKKDNYTCQNCGARSGNGKAVYLEAHHTPISFSKIIKKYKIQSLAEALKCKELWNLENGKTLCLDCHNPLRGRRI